MARLKAPLGASALASVARAMGASASVVVSGLVLLTVGSIGATAYKAGGLIEPIGLGLLALLAAAGVFLVFGLFSGFLRLSERAAEADIVKTVADGFDTGLQIVSRTGALLYRNQALRSLAGTRSGRQATLEELFAGEPQSTEAFYRLNRAADRGEAREEECVRAAERPRQAGRPLVAGIGDTLSRHGRGRPGRAADALAGARRDARAHARDRDGRAASGRCSPSMTTCPRGSSPWPPDGRIAHINTTLAQWLGLQGGIGAGADAGGRGVVRRRGADPCRRPGRARHAARPRSVARGRPRLSRAPGVPRPWHARRALDPGARPQRERAGEGAGARQRRSSPRTVQAAPFGIATVGSDGRILDANTAFMRMFLRDDGPPETVDDLAPSSDERGERGVDAGAAAGLLGSHGGEPGGGVPGLPARVRAPHLREPARHRRAGARGRDPLRHRRHRAEGAGAEVRPQPQDGGRGPAGGRRGARLQQRAHRHHRLLRSAAADAPAHRPRLSRHHEHQEQRQPRRRPGAPAARLLAAPDAAGGGAGAGRAADRSLRAPQQGAGREDRAQDPARPRPLARQGRQDPVRARDHQPRGECQGRHARRRPPHHPPAQRVRARELEARGPWPWPPASTCWWRWRIPASASRPT